MVDGWSVGSAVLESFEHQIAHCADISLDTFEPVRIVIAILGALSIDAVTFQAEFSVQAGEHGVVGESFARDGCQ